MASVSRWEESCRAARPAPHCCQGATRTPAQAPTGDHSRGPRPRSVRRLRVGSHPLSPLQGDFLLDTKKTSPAPRHHAPGTVCFFHKDSSNTRASTPTERLPCHAHTSLWHNSACDTLSALGHQASGVDDMETFSLWSSRKHTGTAVCADGMGAGMPSGMDSTRGMVRSHAESDPVNQGRVAGI